MLRPPPPSGAPAPAPFPPPPETHEPAGWLARIVAARGGSALLVGVLLGLIVLAALGWRAWEERVGLVERETDRSELLARVLEDHATRSFEATSAALGGLASVAETSGPEALRRAMTQALVALPYVRAIAMVDADGRVVASSHPGDEGLRVSLSLLVPARGEAIGSWLPGRQLEDFAELTAGGHVPGTVDRSAVGFIPCVHPLRQGAYAGAHMVALVNPASLVGFQRLAVSEAGVRTVLASWRGQVLIAQAGGAGQLPDSLLPRSDVRSHAIFSRYLPDVEHATFTAAGADGEAQITAFRASRPFPLVAFVERPQRLVEAQWRAAVRPLWMAGLPGLSLIGVLTWLAWRSQRARAAVGGALSQARASMERREHELRVLVSSLHEAILRTDAAGVVRYVSPRWEALTGVVQADVMDQPLADVFVRTDRGAVRDLFIADSAGTVRSVQVRIGQGTGKRRFALSVAPLDAAGGEPGFVGSLQDVTEAWQAQQHLEMQRALNARLLEVSPVPLSILDADGRYLSVNRAWEALTLRRREDVLGRPARQYLPTDQASVHDAHDARLMQQGGEVSYATTLTLADGQRREVMVSKVLVPGADQGRPAVLNAIFDVTEFHEAERATREARDAAEEASRAKSEFIANISHELRTPLQSITGFSELGLMRPPSPDFARMLFTDILSAGQRMLALVNDLLDVAKLESTVGTFHLERTDLRGLAREVVREFTPQCAQRGLAIELHLADAPLVAKVDPLRFQQVLRNVLANALKFSPRGGVVEVRGEVEAAAAQRAADAAAEIHFTVRDHGPGIPAAELDQVFDAFVQSSATKDGSGGTGLGLAICRKIMDAHGGSIVADNAPEGGAVFHLRLPLRTVEETAPMPL
ncbi:PAS domain S-box protein [Ideonella sp.]|uniref:PAS domain S-box protein n=1 Tax=Ideonella sp. TaxID=1929293 RepID=UPI0035AE9105